MTWGSGGVLPFDGDNDSCGHGPLYKRVKNESEKEIRAGSGHLRVGGRWADDHVVGGRVGGEWERVVGSGWQRRWTEHVVQ